MIDIDQFEIISVEVFLRSGVGAFSWLLIVAQVSCKQSWFKEECNPSVTQIPEIKSGNTIHAPTCKVKKQLQIQWNRERLKFVSYTSNL